VLTGAREVLATAIDHAIVQVGPTATLLGVREMLCGPFAQSSSAGSAPLPGAADMESPLDEICIPAICTASELLLRLNGAPDKLARWLREPVAVHDGTIALSGRAWQKVNRAVWDALCGGDGSLDSVVCALSRRLRNARDR
jgi:hypothetical protein